MPKSEAYTSYNVEFRSLIRPGNRDYIVLGWGSFEAPIVKIDLREIWLQKVCEALKPAHTRECTRVGPAMLAPEMRTVGLFMVGDTGCYGRARIASIRPTRPSARLRPRLALATANSGPMAI